MALFDPGLVSGFSAAIETAINTALRYDPASRQMLGTMTDILAVESTLPPLTFYICGSERGVRVASYREEVIATHLKGTPLALASLLNKPTNLANSGVDLVGSTRLLQQWQQLLSQLDIDWEEALSDVMGDMASQPLAALLRNSFSWVKNQERQHQAQVKNYIYEELKLVPTKSELDGFYREVGELVFSLDRLEARLARLGKAQQEKKSVL